MKNENIRNILFSPPDIGQDEINDITAALHSGWITAGSCTKLLERGLAYQNRGSGY